MWYTTSGGGNIIHPSFCGRWAYVAPTKRWKSSCLRTKCSWITGPPPFRWGHDVHPGVCRQVQKLSSSKWWIGCDLRISWSSMRHSNFGFWSHVLPSFSRWKCRCASPQWWWCCGLWILGTHSIARTWARCLLHVPGNVGMVGGFSSC